MTGPGMMRSSKTPASALSKEKIGERRTAVGSKILNFINLPIGYQYICTATICTAATTINSIKSGI